MNKLTGKICVVTGGEGLLGRAIVSGIIAEGGTAVVLDISVEDNIENNLLFCDVANEDSLKGAIGRILTKYDRIDGWVNNAYPRTKDWGSKFEAVELDSWRKNVDMQMNSIFTASQLVTGVMKDQKGGSIVNISSIYGMVGPDFSIYRGTEMTVPAAYSAIKGGIISFSRYLASYFGEFGVRVNCVSPGGIFDNQNHGFVNNYQEKVPLKRMGLPGDIAPAVIFLLSNDASYITGHNLVVDGGWTAI